MNKVLIVVFALEGGVTETVEISNLTAQQLQRARSYINDQDVLSFMEDILREIPEDMSRIPYRFIEAHVDLRLETLLR